MDRRTILKCLTVYTAGLPVLPNVSWGLDYATQWRAWLQTLVDHCRIEPIQAFFYPGALPKETVEDFSSATNTYYFYQQRQYCFTVLEKKHPTAGLLELALPFWRLQADGNWEKVSCLSLFQLEALAKVSAGLAKTAVDDMESYLLPIALSPTLTSNYKTANGAVCLQSRVQTSGVMTAVQIKSKQTVLWQEVIESAHCLTCQI